MSYHIWQHVTSLYIVYFSIWFSPEAFVHNNYILHVFAHIVDANADFSWSNNHVKLTHSLGLRVLEELTPKITRDARFRSLYVNLD